MRRILLLIAALAIPAFAGVPVSPGIFPHVTFVDGAGLPCAGCKLSTFAAGSTTPLATYVDSSGTSTNQNPIVLDAAGGANIWVGANSYKFILKDALGNTIWTVDNVNAGNLFPCASPGAIQIANSGGTGLTCDSSITINTSNHTLNVGTLPSLHVTIGALGTPTSWTLDTTTPQTACASLGCGGVNGGTINQLAYYASAGTTVSGTSSIPVGITAADQAIDNNSGLVANTKYVKTPGAINPTSVQVASGIAMTDNQGNGTKVQHSTGTTTSGHGAEFDANGNVVDAGNPYPITTPRTCSGNSCYLVQGDGTIVQWGTVSAPTSGGTLVNVAIVFPVPFVNSLQSLTVSGGSQPDGTDDAYSIYTKSATSVGATAVVRCSTNIGGSGCGSLSEAVPVNWYAIGF